MTIQTFTHRYQECGSSVAESIVSIALIALLTSIGIQYVFRFETQFLGRVSRRAVMLLTEARAIGQQEEVNCSLDTGQPRKLICRSNMKTFSLSFPQRITATLRSSIGEIRFRPTGSASPASLTLESIDEQQCSILVSLRSRISLKCL